jgi:hypothetical protein
LNSLRRFLRDWPVVEAIFLVAIVAGYAVAWRHPRTESGFSDATRQLIAYTVLYVLSGTLAAASIMLSGTLIGLQVAVSLNAEAKTHIRHAVGWSILSIIAGAWDLALLPSRVGAHNLATDSTVAIFGALQLFCMVFAAVRILCAVRIALR